MKLARLSVLVLAIVSMLAVPDAFGKGKKGGGALGQQPPNKNVATCDGDYYIYCYYEPIDACCWGDFSFCYGACVGLCGGPCDT